MGTNDKSKFSLSLLRAQVDACRVVNWRSKFEGKKCTIKTCMLDLPDDFIEYLHTDGVMLPEPSDQSLLHFDDPRKVKDSESDDGSWCDASDVPASRLAQMANMQLDEEDDDSSDDENEKESTKLANVSFKALETQINEAIEKLGGRVAPKLDWSVPQDSTWLKGTLCCSNPGDVFLLLKGSDFVQHDLSHAYDYCADYEAGLDAPGTIQPFKLSLLKWCNLYESMELRCIVYNRELRVVCQRNCRTVFKGLQDELKRVEQEEHGNIVQLVHEFFKHNVESTFELEHYTFDVYVDKQRRVYLLDFAPLPTITYEEFPLELTASKCSNCLLETPPHHLVSWSDLNNMLQSEEPVVEPEFRIVTSESEAAGNVLGMHKVPVELVQGKMTSDFVADSLSKLDSFTN